MALDVAKEIILLDTIDSGVSDKSKSILGAIAWTSTLFCSDPWA